MCMGLGGCALQPCLSHPHPTAHAALWRPCTPTPCITPVPPLYVSRDHFSAALLRTEGGKSISIILMYVRVVFVYVCCYNIDWKYKLH